jgi:O-antigen ligase
MLSENNILKWQNWLLMGIAFLIPLFPRLVPILIMAFTLLSFTAIIKGFRRVEVTEVGILMIGLYVLFLIGMFFTDNLERGWFNLEVKLSLVAFPISFIGYGYMDKRQYERILYTFLLGVLIAAVYCLGQSAYKVFFRNAKYFHFLSNRYSVIIHQSYFAMYLVFATVILTYMEWPVFRRDKIGRTIATIVGILFLSISTIMTGSKIGFIMWIVVICTITIYLIQELKYKWLPISMLMVLMSVAGAFIQTTPELKTRILKLIELNEGELARDVTGNIESTSARTVVYKSAWNVIKNQPWYGSGTGDYQDALDEEYLTKGDQNLYNRHLNAHNLFLQTWISTGIPGLMLIFSIFVVIFQHSFSTGERVYLAFSAVIALISLTESPFNVQAGVVFFSFFAMVFSRHTLPDT